VSDLLSLDKKVYIQYKVKLQN